MGAPLDMGFRMYGARQEPPALRAGIGVSRGSGSGSAIMSISSPSNPEKCDVFATMLQRNQLFLRSSKRKSGAASDRSD